MWNKKVILRKVYHQTVKKVTEDYEALHFNTAISQLMVFINDAYKADDFTNQLYGRLCETYCHQFAPHIAEELWEKLGYSGTIAYEAWPAYDEAKLVDDEVEIVIQINGKVKHKLTGTNQIRIKMH